MLDNIKYIDSDLIKANEKQPRKEFNDETIKELASSIKKRGILQPIIVTKKEDKYIIVAGERRFRASNIAGIKTIPCIIKELSDEEIIEIALLENIQREDLNVFEEALAYKNVMEKKLITQAELAETIGKSRPYISNTIRMLKLNEEVIDMIIQNKLSSGHGKAILKLKDKDKQLQVAKDVIKNNMSVRKTEEYINRLTKKENKKDIFEIDIEERLIEKFNTKVSIKRGSKKGKIEIEYYNEDSLNDIIQKLLDS